MRLFVHVEEPSMKETMLVLLPRLIRGRDIAFKIIDHGSKRSLLTNVPKRFMGYARSYTLDIRVLVLLDRDNDDCIELKKQLESAAHAAGLHTKSGPDPSGRFRVVNRIVVEELESWFFGDLNALEIAYAGVSSKLKRDAAVRNPDAIKGGTWETLQKRLQSAGHYLGTKRLPKIDVARRVSAHMEPSRNISKSFRTFIAGLDALVSH